MEPNTIEVDAAFAKILTDAGFAPDEPCEINTAAIKSTKISGPKSIKFSASGAFEPSASMEKWLDIMTNGLNATVDVTRLDPRTLAGVGLNDRRTRERTIYYLHRAVAYLQTDGWCQFTMHVDYPDGSQKHCALGALERAICGPRGQVPVQGGTVEADFKRCALLLSHALGGVPVPHWNDAPQRRAEQVVHAMLDVADHLAAV